MITLKKNADRRLRRGHLWIFSNEIADPKVSELEPGSVHEIRDSGGEFLGMAYANPASLIAARILSRKREPIDQAFIRARIAAAYERRKRLFPERNAYRIVFGESDLLPGLVVDRYANYLAVQVLSAGMENLLTEVLESLIEMIAPEGICLRNDSPVRLLEGLEEEKRTAYGSIPDMVEIQSGPLKIQVDISNGQKTGYFLDQECNRSVMHRYVHPGAAVLDLYCYSGAWGLHAAYAGASEVVGVDSSRGALNLAAENARINGLEDRFEGVRDSAVDFLKKNARTWDAIVLDPPAFIKSRNRIKEGQKGYIDVNRRALTRLNRDGILVTCSCSHHLDLVSFEEIVSSASRQAGKELRILDIRGQGPDHPVLWAMPETRYLKVIVAQVI